jgi:hypothetical protein
VIILKVNERIFPAIGLLKIKSKKNYTIFSIMKKLRIFLLMLMFPFAIFAQQDTLHKNYKNYYGIGLSLGKGSDDYGYNKAYIYWQRKANYLSIGFSDISKDGFFMGDTPRPETGDAYIIIGKSIMFNPYINLKFGAGVAFVEDVSRGKFLYNTCKSMFCLLDTDVYETIKKRGVGFPLELNTNFYVSRRFALSLGFNANINTINSFYGLSLGIMGGRLRDKIILK